MTVHMVFTAMMRTKVARWPRMPALYAAGTGFGCGIVVTIASATADGVNTLAAPVLMVAIVASLSTVVGALATALQAWLLYAGFVISHAGQVALNDASANAALVLVGTAVGATLVGAVIRWIQLPYVVSVPAPRSHLAYQDGVKLRALQR